MEDGSEWAANISDLENGISNEPVRLPLPSHMCIAVVAVWTIIWQMLSKDNISS